jgi:predicted RNase H-like HicB family nuclease
MIPTCRFQSIIVREDDDLYIARCTDLDITSEGDTVEAARANLSEAVERFLETAEPDEVVRRMRAARTA